ncbi:MAG: hypothetical protein PHI13_16570, partial [Methylococcales bacterium]|nr:hypothetical protein [Methylococcales bacterium]
IARTGRFNWLSLHSAVVEIGLLLSKLAINEDDYPLSIDILRLDSLAGKESSPANESKMLDLHADLM